MTTARAMSLGAQARADFIDRIAAAIWATEYSSTYGLSWQGAKAYVDQNREDHATLLLLEMSAVVPTIKRCAVNALAAMRLTTANGYTAFRLCEAGAAAADIEHHQAAACFNGIIDEALG